MQLTSTFKINFIFFLSFFILFSSQSKCQSLLGAEIGYNFSKENGLEIFLKTYSYCDGSNINAAEIEVNDSRKIQKLKLTLTSSEDITPLCASLESKCKNPNSLFPYGIRRDIFTGKLDATTLVNCDVNISWQGGKRSSAITNLEAGQDFFIEANFSFCNEDTINGPEFEFLPMTNIYTDHNVNQYQSARNTNKDDSFSYEIIAPRSSVYKEVAYTNSFNALQPFGLNNPFSYDKSSGLVNANASAEGVNAVAYKVILWGKDSLGNRYFKGEVVRDIATIITKNTGQKLPQLYGYGSNFGTINKPVHYSIHNINIISSDSNKNDSVTITWNEGIKDRVKFNLEQNKKFPKAAINFNTDYQAPSTIKKYTFIISVIDNGCPLRSKVQNEYNFIVASHEKLLDKENEFICLGDTLQLKATGGKFHQWRENDWQNKEILKDSIVSPKTTTTYWITAKDRILGCGLIDKLTVNVCEDCVWPGETNKDGEVNLKDILPIGVSINKEGIKRPVESTVWKSQYSTDWNTYLNSDINNKHSDCDGDSVIRKEDVNVVLKNYTQNPDATFRFQNGRNTDPELGMLYYKSYYMAGETVTADIFLGTPVNQAKDMYGIALRYGYNSEIIEPGSLKMETTKSWLTNKDNDFNLIKDFPEIGIFDLGFCRTNHQSADGIGKIATIQFKLKKNIKN